MAAEIFGVGPLDTAWRMGKAAPARRRLQAISCVLPSVDQLDQQMPYEVRQLELKRGDESLAVYMGGRDFPSACPARHLTGR